MTEQLPQELAQHIPFLRRYSRALTGDQDTGDALVRTCEQAITSGSAFLPKGVNARVGLYQLFHNMLPSGVDHARPASQQALLLTTVEGFSNGEAAQIMDVPDWHVQDLCIQALSEVERQTVADVLIIEDEPMISIDLTGIVEEMGHAVVGIARTYTEALDAIQTRKPGLILTDIQLADGSSGIDAANSILAELKVPVIFITAFPERLLTGNRPEPTFLITKPYDPDTVKAAISQALFLTTTVQLAA